MHITHHHIQANIWKDAEFAGIGATEMNETAFGVRTKKGMLFSPVYSPPPISSNNQDSILLIIAGAVVERLIGQI